MRIQRFVPPVLWILLLFAILISYGIGSALSAGQIQDPSAAQSNTQAAEQSLKRVKNLIPSHIPIKVKVKHLEINKKMRDIEIEVTNTAAKPIYYINLVLRLIRVRDENNIPMAVRFQYGRIQLVNFQTEITPEDVPINPGETVTLKMPDTDAEGWEEYRTRKNIAEQVEFELRLSILVFGDHTGFVGSHGTAVPHNQNSNQSIFSPIGMKTTQNNR